MKPAKFFFFFLITLTIFSCNGQKSHNLDISIEAYSSYNNSTLPPTISLSKSTTKYDSLINYSMKSIGLLDTDIEIATTRSFGAYSVINRLSYRRFFVYNPAFFDTVYDVTQTNFAILGICFHELAHHFYRHPLKPSNASHFYEKQADRYSGFALALIGATLEESLAAMNNIERLGGSTTQTISHPDKESRLAEIEKGFIDARITIFKDSSFIEWDNNFKMQELMLALQINKSFFDIKSMESLSDSIEVYSEKAIKKSITEEIYSFYGELIYISGDREIKLSSNNEIIGELIKPNQNINTAILSLDGVKFFLEENKIYSINPDGFKLEVGVKLGY